MDRDGVRDLGDRVGDGLERQLRLRGPGIHLDGGRAAGRHLHGSFRHNRRRVGETSDAHSVEQIRGGALGGEQVPDATGPHRERNNVQVLGGAEAEDTGGTGTPAEDVLAADATELVQGGAVDGHHLVERAAEAGGLEARELVAVEELLAQGLRLAGKVGRESGILRGEGLRGGLAEEGVDGRRALQVGDQLLDLLRLAEGLAERGGLLG